MNSSPFKLNFLLSIFFLLGYTSLYAQFDEHYYTVSAKSGKHLNIEGGNRANGTNAQKKMTSFDPKKNGFKFNNRFTVGVEGPFGIKADWNGLCGGMAFSAADYFYSSVKVPSQTYTPAKGTNLYKYLYDRQQNALGASIDKVAENYFNPFGSRNEEFWGWAVNERLKQVKKFIDKNKPVPILLFNALNQDVAKNHWVLAIGYDLGGYKFNKKRDPNVENIKIFVYDPNYPTATCVLSPKKGGDWLLDYHKWNTSDKTKGSKLDSRNRRWRHYYVYNQFRHKRPPAIADEAKTETKYVYKLVLKFKTGGDDLRGGGDNVNVLVEYKNGKSEYFKNVNLGKRWADNSINNAELRLKNKVKHSEIKCLKISTKFGGGMFGDNWNLNYLGIKAYKKDGTTYTFEGVEGSPWMRFTGDHRDKRVYLK